MSIFCVMYIGILVRLDLDKFDLLIRVCQTRTIYVWDVQVNTIQSVLLGQ